MRSRPDLEVIAESTLRSSGMDNVGLYEFQPGGASGVILGMPKAFICAYEVTGMAIDPVLSNLRREGIPCSTLTCLGDSWFDCELYQRVSGHFGLLGFAALPLYRGERLSGVLYFGARSPQNAARLDFAGLCDLSAKAVQVSTTLLALPRVHPRLTERQNQVARLTADGLANREIADELGTGEAAVRKHLKVLNRLFETPNRTAMAAAWRKGSW